jgi:hypothetical protein
MQQWLRLTILDSFRLNMLAWILHWPMNGLHTNPYGGTKGSTYHAVTD